MCSTPRSARSHHCPCHPRGDPGSGYHVGYSLPFIARVLGAVELAQGHPGIKQQDWAPVLSSATPEPAVQLLPKEGESNPSGPKVSFSPLSGKEAGSKRILAGWGVFPSHLLSACSSWRAEVRDEWAEGSRWQCQVPQRATRGLQGIIITPTNMDARNS